MCNKKCLYFPKKEKKKQGKIPSTLFSHIIEEKCVLFHAINTLSNIINDMMKGL